jgi:hypothetical protein
MKCRRVAEDYSFFGAKTNNFSACLFELYLTNKQNFDINLKNCQIRGIGELMAICGNCYAFKINTPIITAKTYFH